MKKVIIPATLVVLLLIVYMLIPREHNLIVKWETVKKELPVATPQIKVYIENSGSMDGYMGDGSQLKDAVYSYVSSLATYSNGKPQLHFINSQVIPYDGSLKSFISDMNPESFKKAGGSRANSDIAQMMETMLAAQGKNTISVFVSDCILDVPEGQANNFFINRQIDIRNAFTKYRNKQKNLSVEIFRLKSNFKGMYYYSLGGEELEGLSRPYYMFVIGDRDVLASINKRVPFSEVKHGIANYCAFTTYEDVSFDMTNEFGVARKNILECRSDKKGKCHLKLKANLLTTLQDDAYVMNPENYRTQNATVSVGAVERMDDTQSPYTHVFTIDLDGKMNPSGEQLRLMRAYHIPPLPRAQLRFRLEPDIHLEPFQNILEDGFCKVNRPLCLRLCDMARQLQPGMLVVEEELRARQSRCLRRTDAEEQADEEPWHHRRVMPERRRQQPRCLLRREVKDVGVLHCAAVQLLQVLLGTDQVLRKGVVVAGDPLVLHAEGEERGQHPVGVVAARNLVLPVVAQEAFHISGDDG